MSVYCYLVYSLLNYHNENDVLFDVPAVLVSMPFSKDKVLIKCMLKLQGYNASQFIKQLPSKGWKTWHK